MQTNEHPPPRPGRPRHRTGATRLHHPVRLLHPPGARQELDGSAVRGGGAAFSSTIVIVKPLSGKRELDSLHGHIAVGFLIAQDLAVVIAMMIMSGLGGMGDEAAGGGTARIASAELTPAKESP